MAIFQRRPSALYPLDGMRAFAILWVLIYHTFHQFFSCTEDSDWRWVLYPVNGGDIGVDIFFVLSGFLISYILIKENDKQGYIDVWNFYRGRFWRLWPTLAVFIVFDSYRKFRVKQLTYLVMIGNFLYQSHVWSVAVEFQFYIISPFIVRHMIWKSDHCCSRKPWLLPAIIWLMSIGFSFYFCWKIAPELLEDVEAWMPKKVKKKLFKFWYINTLTRLSPYVTGMFAGYVHLRTDGQSCILKYSMIFEWLCVFVMAFISYFGARYQYEAFWTPMAQFVYMNISRAIYGLLLSYLLAKMVSVKPEEPLGYRPTACLRACYSSSFWVPLCMISYSLYLYHVPILKIIRSGWNEDFERYTSCAYAPSVGW